MDEIRIYAGMIVREKAGLRWRVFTMLNLICGLIQLDTEKCIIREMPASDIMESISFGELAIETDEPIIVDESQMDESVLSDYKKKLEFIREFEGLYGPSFVGFTRYGSKKEYKSLYTRYGFSVVLANRLVRRWLQSGRQDSALLDQRMISAGSKIYNYTKKTGRPSSRSQGMIITDEIRTCFDYGVSLYCGQRLITKREAYARMLRKYFVVQVGNHAELLPPDQRPTERQFMVYLQSKVSKEMESKIKTSNIEYRNNERLLLGTPQDAAMRPGFVLEADALEIDLNIVSSMDREKNASRPILYMMVDLYSHAIVAFHVGFENNSTLGLTSLMLNLIEDKKELLERNGLSMDLSFWPSPFLPHEIRCDRGSDFASDAFEGICRDLNITRTLEPGAMGSMKGMIEQSFRLFHQGIRTDLEKKGIIQKRYDSNHKLEACITIEDVFKLILEFVRYHNTYYIKKFRITREMQAKGVDKTPIAIWNYGITHYGEPYPITAYSRTEIIFRLLPESNATISREGVSFRNLLYVNKNDEDLITRMKLAKSNANKKDGMGKRKNSITIRFDPRSINNLYYLKDGRLQAMTILSSKCGNLKDMTWEEYGEFRKAEPDQDRDGYEANIINRFIRIDTTRQIASEATPETYADPHGIRETRKTEKNRVNFSDRVQQRLDIDNEEIEEAPAIPPSEEPVKLKGSLFSPECPEDLWNM